MPHLRILRLIEFSTISIKYDMVENVFVSEIQASEVPPSFQFLPVYRVKCLKLGIFEAAKHRLSIAGRAKAGVQMTHFFT